MTTASTPPPLRVLPMQLQLGDRLSDERADWRVVSRVLTHTHHVLGGRPIEDGDALAYFPVPSSDEAERLERRLIALLHPEWNDGGAPREHIDEVALREAVAVLENVNGSVSDGGTQ